MLPPDHKMEPPGFSPPVNQPINKLTNLWRRYVGGSIGLVPRKPSPLSTNFD